MILPLFSFAFFAAASPVPSDWRSAIVSRPKPIYLATPLRAPQTPTRPALGSEVTAKPGLPSGSRVWKFEVLPVFGPLLFLGPTRQSVLPEVKTGGASPIPIKPKAGIEDTLCDVICSSSDLTTVLSMLSATTRANLVAIASTQDKLSLSLRRVKLSEALKLITASVGMTYLRVGSAFVIGPEEKLKTGYPSEWLKAHPIAKATTPAIPDSVATEPPPSTPVDLVRTLIYPLNHSVPNQMLETLKALFGARGLEIAVGPGSQSPTLMDKDASSGTGITTGLLQSEGKPSGKTLILRGPNSVVTEAVQAIKDLDVARAQVSIEVTIFDVTDNALNELGVSWTIGGTNFTEGTPQGVNFGSFTRTPFNFGATIKALETADKAKILASPNVSVLDEERAFVLIGNKITLPKFDGYDANKIPIYSTQEFKVGIYLQVAPSVSADGTITMAIYPQVSTIVKFTEINGGSYPDIATRAAQTTLRVKSGESIVLGGLLKNEELNQLEQVPLLSRIPIFGELFKRRKKTKGSSQVIISLTPTLIKAP